MGVNIGGVGGVVLLLLAGIAFVFIRRRPVASTVAPLTPNSRSSEYGMISQSKYTAASSLPDEATDAHYKEFCGAKELDAMNNDIDVNPRTPYAATLESTALKDASEHTGDVVSL
jgi:hypothetical protein